MDNQKYFLERIQIDTNDLNSTLLISNLKTFFNSNIISLNSQEDVLLVKITDFNDYMSCSDFDCSSKKDQTYCLCDMNNSFFDKLHKCIANSKGEDKFSIYIELDTNYPLIDSLVFEESLLSMSNQVCIKYILMDSSTKQVIIKKINCGNYTEKLIDTEKLNVRSINIPLEFLPEMIFSCMSNYDDYVEFILKIADYCYSDICLLVSIFSEAEKMNLDIWKLSTTCFRMIEEFR